MSNNDEYVDETELKSRFASLMNQTWQIFKRAVGSTIPEQEFKASQQRWYDVLQKEKEHGKEYFQSVVVALKTWVYQAFINDNDPKKTIELVKLFFGGWRELKLAADWKDVYTAVKAQDPTFKGFTRFNRDEAKRFLHAYDRYFKDKLTTEASTDGPDDDFFRMLETTARPYQNAATGQFLRMWFDKTGPWAPQANQTKAPASASGEVDINTMKAVQLENDIKEKGVQLAELEGQKAAAVAAEDFTLAGELKGRIAAATASITDLTDELTALRAQASPSETVALEAQGEAVEVGTLESDVLAPESIPASSASNLTASALIVQIGVSDLDEDTKAALLNLVAKGDLEDAKRRFEAVSEV